MWCWLGAPLFGLVANSLVSAAAACILYFFDIINLSQAKIIVVVFAITGFFLGGYYGVAGGLRMKRMARNETNTIN
jgi:hypothetical protein